MRAKTAAAHADAAARAHEAGDLSSAEREFSLAIELEPNLDRYLYDLGRLYYEQDNLDRAQSLFRRTVNVNFSYALAIKGLGYTVHRLGKLNEAVYCYLRYLDAEPDDVDVHANLVAALEAQGRYDEAVTAAKKAVERFPKNSSLVFMLARNNFFAGKVDAALTQLAKAQKLDPDNPEIYRILGVALKTKGDLKAALANFNEAIQRDPTDAAAHLAAADVYRRLDRDEEYLQSARKARLLFEASNNRDGLKNACWEESWALYKLKRWEESIEASKCALEVDPELTPVRFNLGLALLRLGRPDLAKREYEKALEKADGGALKADAIDDLAAALKEEPDLPFAKQLLETLEDRYRAAMMKQEAEVVTVSSEK
jgi:tetratricopeptide (TPR) repeat protein